MIDRSFRLGFALAAVGIFTLAGSPALGYDCTPAPAPSCTPQPPIALTQGPTNGPLTHQPGMPFFVDGAGVPVYLTGSHTWDSFQDWGDTSSNSPRSDFDFDDYLNLLACNGHNFMRLWVWEGTSNGDPVWRPNIGPLPWTWQPAQPSREKDKSTPAGWNLDQFDPEYFERLACRVGKARDRGIYVGVMLFQGWSVREVCCGLDPWPSHPFRAGKNVNGLDGNSNPGLAGGWELHRGPSNDVEGYQQAYVTRVVDTLENYDNVLWEISNESGAGSENWQYNMISLVAALDANDHPIGMTSQGSMISNDPLTNSAASWISPTNAGADNYSGDPPVNDGDQVVIVDSDHLEPLLMATSPATYRDWIWKNLTRGNQTIAMDPVQHAFTVDLNPSLPSTDWPKVRKSLGRARHYAEKLDWTVARPDPSVCSTRFCVAESDAKFLVYQPDSDSFEVSTGPGVFTRQWFNDANGMVIDHPPLTITDPSRSFNPPFMGPAVLFLERIEGVPAIRLTLADQGVPNTTVLPPEGLIDLGVVGFRRGGWQEVAIHNDGTAVLEVDASAIMPPGMFAQPELQNGSIEPGTFEIVGFGGFPVCDQTTVWDVTVSSNDPDDSVFPFQVEIGSDCWLDIDLLAGVGGGLLLLPGSPNEPYPLPGSTPRNTPRDYTFVVRNTEDVAIDLDIVIEAEPCLEVVETVAPGLAPGAEASFVVRLECPTAGTVWGAIEIDAANRPSIGRDYYIEGTVVP